MISSVWIPWIDPRTKFPTLNDMIDWEAGSIYKYRRNKKTWVDHVIFSAARMKPVTRRVSVAMYWMEINKSRDPDNIAAFKKVIMDALVDAKKLQGDGWKWIGGYRDYFMIDKKAPGVLIEFRWV